MGNPCRNTMNEVLYVATCINVGTVFDPAKNKVTTAGKEVMSLYLKWQMGYLLRFTHSSCIFVGVVNFGMKYRWDEAYYNVIFLFFFGKTFLWHCAIKHISIPIILCRWFVSLVLKFMLHYINTCWNRNDLFRNCFLTHF